MCYMSGSYVTVIEILERVLQATCTLNYCQLQHNVMLEWELQKQRTSRLKWTEMHEKNQSHGEDSRIKYEFCYEWKDYILIQINTV